KFTTVYNLRAHMKGHEQESLFKCEVCAERFPTHAKLSSHQRSHFEPERPYKCDFPGCEKTFITVSALFSHNRAHFREQELFSCSFPGCSKQYDKACRLKIHLRSHTGCCARFSARSSLYIHSKKHLQDVAAPKSRCPVSSCHRLFSSKHSVKAHTSSLRWELQAPLVLGTAATVLQQGSLAADDVQAVDAGALGCLVALPVKSLSRDPQAFTSASGPQGDDSAPELLVPIKVEPDLAPGPDAVRQQAWSGGALRPVESSPAEELGPRKDAGLGAGPGGFYLEGGGSARTDSRAIQLAKEKKQKGAGSHTGEAVCGEGAGRVSWGPPGGMWRCGSPVQEHC
ncbi:hypothetical protein E2I00_014172, partial [Balaenoptera physalus]